MSRQRKLVLVLLGVAVLARVVAAVALGNKFYFADETEYVDAARRLLAGGGYAESFDRVPAYPAYLAILLGITPASLTALRTVHAIIAALSCWLTFRLADRLFGFWTAAAAAAFVAIDPLLTVSSALFYPEAITGIVVLIAVTLVLAPSYPKHWPSSAAVGALLGVGFQLRQVTLFFLPIMLVWSFVRTHPPRIRQGSVRAALLVASFLLVLTPWTLRNYRVRGSFSPLATAGVPGTPLSAAVRSNQDPTRAMLDRVRNDTKWLALSTARRFAAFWELYPTRLATDDPQERAEMHAHDSRLPTDSSFPRGLRNTVSMVAVGGEFLFAILGLGFALRRRRAESLFLLGAILSFAFGYALFVSKMRYRIPILPLLFIFSGAGLVGLLSMLRTSLGIAPGVRK